MKYFCRNEEREGSAYYEFQKGDWQKEKKYWKEDSICMEDEVYWKYLMDAVEAVIPGQNPYGPTRVSPAQWKAILAKSRALGGITKEAAEEADLWARDVLKEHGCFTILGV